MLGLSIVGFPSPLIAENSQTSTSRKTSGYVALPRSERKRLVPRTLVFSRTQSQYSLSFNYLHSYRPEWYWIDRPLFFDRSLAAVGRYNSEIFAPAFSRVIQSARPYELDGFSHLVTVPSQKRNYLQALAVSEKQPNGAFPILIELAGNGSSVSDIVASTSELIDKALASPAAQRIDGKLLITSYGLDADSPKTWAQAVAILRQKYPDQFLLVASISRGWWKPYINGQDGSYRPEDLDEMKAKLREWLDACDGIMHVGVGHDTDPADQNRLDQKFYEFIVALCTSVLNEPAYQQKYFGLSAAIGYFNPVTGSRSNEDGTRYLRHSLRIAIGGHPDFIILPEWDEVNECTSIQPTVYNSLSTQRIIRHTMRELKGQPSAPNPGDDTTIPNLVVSYRQFLMLGEALEVEVLGIPDGALEVHGDYGIQLSLKDANHQVVKVLPKITLTSSEMAEKRLTIATEELAKHPLLMPSLEVTMPDGRTQTFEEGLACIRLYPTMNWNYKWVKTSLRDLLRPLASSFVLEPNANSSLQVRGSVTSDEKIVSVEVVGDGLELFAVDPQKTYELGPDEALILMQETSPDNLGDFNGRYEVRGGHIRQMNSQYAYWAARTPGQTAPRLTCSPLGQIMVINQKGSAVIHVENDLFKTTIPVATVLKEGSYSEVHGRGATLTLQAFHGVPEMPLPLQSKEVSFRADIKSIRPETAFQMRVITESGKIYRSWPILPGESPKKSTEASMLGRLQSRMAEWFGTPSRLKSPKNPEGYVALPVYSETKREPVTVQVAPSRIPSLHATPARTSGAEIHTSSDPYFNGLAGGVPPWSYVIQKTGSYPKDALQSAPTRVMEDGFDCWSFDGKGNFLYFPPETLPRGAFSISFTFKPLSRAPQVLLANNGYVNGAFRLNIVDGVVSGTYTDLLRRKEPYLRTMPLEPEIVVPIGQWSTVEVSYDLKQIIFKVNGKAGKPIPLSTKGLIYSPLLFGGYGPNGFFHGFLKDLNIRHTAAN